MAKEKKRAIAEESGTYDKSDYEFDANGHPVALTRQRTARMMGKAGDTSKRVLPSTVVLNAG
jgi:hypothetical protein